jgi:[acyl-carrier-protein] S-malonyltransferase
MTTSTPTFLGSVMKAIACTPNRNVDAQAYDTGALQPARHIRKRWNELGDRRPSDDEIREVMALLARILETKMVDVEERADRVAEIVERHDLRHLFPEAATPSSRVP